MMVIVIDSVERGRECENAGRAGGGGRGHKPNFGVVGMRSVQGVPLSIYILPTYL